MKTIEWGFLIVNYLFLGGLSAGLFFVAALAGVGWSAHQRGSGHLHWRVVRSGSVAPILEHQSGSAVVPVFGPLNRVRGPHPRTDRPGKTGPGIKVALWPRHLLHGIGIL